MANINALTASINGFDSMTAEQKLAAILALTYDDGKDEIERLKNSVTKSNAEAAEWKRKHNALLDDEGRKKQEEEDRYKALQDALDEKNKALEAYMRSSKVSDHASKLIACGWTEANAKAAAEALVDGDTAKYLDLNTAFLTANKENIRQELLKNTPQNPPSAGGGAVDYAKQIEAARAAGDTARVVYLMRKQNELKE